MLFPHGETVTRLRAVLIADPYSDDDTVQVWDSPSRVDYTCAVWPGGSTEPLSADRQSVQSDIEVAFPTGADVTARDRLEVRGGVYAVDGEPFDWRSPLTGWQPGLIARASKQEG